jgi:hypothetical protein
LLAAGGFLLSEYRPRIAEEFEIAVRAFSRWRLLFAAWDSPT